MTDKQTPTELKPDLLAWIELFVTSKYDFNISRSAVKASCDELKDKFIEVLGAAKEMSAGRRYLADALAESRKETERARLDLKEDNLSNEKLRFALNKQISTLTAQRKELVEALESIWISEEYETGWLCFSAGPIAIVYTSHDSENYEIALKWKEKRDLALANAKGEKE